MSTASVNVTRGGQVSLPGITPATTASLNALLTRNHREHHIFFNSEGFHDHIVHHLLALYDLGAQPPVLTAAFNSNATYQRPIKGGPAPEYKLPEQWEECLEKHDAYISWLRYFLSEIHVKGHEKVLSETFFAGTKRADDMLVRLLAGFIHPFIHLGYGLEFSSPEIIAEACAMAAISENWLGGVLFPAEERAGTAGDPKARVLDLLKEVRENEKLRTAPHWDDGNKIKGILQRAPEEMLAVASKFVVPEEKIEEKMWEVFAASSLYTAAAQRGNKEIRMDFYFLHAHNSSLFLPIFLRAPFLTTRDKVRLLEWKGRHDIALYASRRAPDLRVEDVTDYIPKDRSHDDSNYWFGIVERAMRVKEDDGHLIKLVRGCMLGEKECPEGDGMQKGMWRRMAEMAVDSVEEEGRMWIRSCGFDEAWEEYGPRKKR